jgi:hypothetical protein
MWSKRLINIFLFSKKLTLELSGVGGAGSLFHQALEVVVEEALALEDLVQVDVVELAGVEGLRRRLGRRLHRLCRRSLGSRSGGRLGRRGGGRRAAGLLLGGGCVPGDAGGQSAGGQRQKQEAETEHGY